MNRHEQLEQSERLDRALVLRGLAGSRARAKVLIGEGVVALNGKVLSDPSALTYDKDTIILAHPDMFWVSRSALKLAHALDHWNIDPKGKVVLDVGASTGGFTELLLSRGAAKVYALDVGHGQLAQKLREDPRVVNFEGVHVNEVLPPSFSPPPDLLVVDVSFISLLKILEKIKELSGAHGQVILLVKPQFEVGRNAIKKGVVKDPLLHTRAVGEVRKFAMTIGFTASEPIVSPIVGGDGNKEFLLLLSIA